MKPLRYVLYAVWRWKLKDPREQFPLLVATMSLALSLSFNVFAAVFAEEYLTGTRWLNEMGRNQVASMALVMCITMFLIVHTSWVSNGKFAAVVSEFQDEPDGVRLRHTIYVVAYLVATIVILVVFGVLA